MPIVRSEIEKNERERGNLFMMNVVVRQKNLGTFYEL